MKLEEKAILHFLDRFDETPFLVKIREEEYTIGHGNPRFSIIFKKEPDLKEMITSTSLALGEAYMRGDLEIDGDLYQALYYFLGQMGNFSVDTRVLRKLMFPSLGRRKQKEDVASHYDLGNDFYSLWLDETLNYSCGYFENEQDTLFDAQKKKTQRILEKLYLKEGMELLDIGCGWGYLLIEAAKKYKIRGTGITLSREQQQGFEKRIREEGLEDYLHAELMDYRDLAGYGKKFDRVVSVGMLEHVGRDHYELFFQCIKRAMKPGGVFLLHFISALEEHPGDPWMKKYIFPGGVIPSLREITSLSAKYRFYLLDAESLRRHYNKTLLCWDKNFNEHRREIEERFGETFSRMWDLYLCACASTFQNGIIDLHQLLFTNGINNELQIGRAHV